MKKTIKTIAALVFCAALVWCMGEPAGKLDASWFIGDAIGFAVLIAAAAVYLKINVKSL